MNGPAQNVEQYKQRLLMVLLDPDSLSGLSKSSSHKSQRRKPRVGLIACRFLSVSFLSKIVLIVCPLLKPHSPRPLALGGPENPEIIESICCLNLYAVV